MTDAPKCEKCGIEMIEAESHWDPVKQEYKYIRWECPRFLMAYWVRGCDYAVMKSKFEALTKRNEELERIFSESLIYAREKLNELCSAESRAQKAESERDAALKARDEAADQVVVLREALEELIEVADLRGDSDLPHPADDPKLWTARMIDAWDGGRDALSNTSALAAQRKREIQRAEVDHQLDKCPKCGGPADNGFDRCVPPSAYFCTKCSAQQQEDSHD